MKLEKITIPIQRILPPSLQQIAKEDYETEIRLHPLLPWFWAAICTARADYKPYFVPESLLNELMTPRVHYFADPEKHTPKDPNYGHIHVNDAVAFPNLWPWTPMAIVRITSPSEESLFLPDIKVQQWFDAFVCSEQYFKQYRKTHPSQRFYPTINMNFLRPSASSVLHPHLQSLILPVAPPLIALFLQEAQTYYKKHHQSFFEAYIAHEWKSPRWIGSIGVPPHKISFVSPWAPLAGTDEVFFISHSHSSIPLPKQTWHNIAEGLHRIFVGYHTMGIRSINFIICSDFYNNQSQSFRTFGMLWSRPLKNLDISDRGFAEIGYKMALTFRSPEMVASDLRKFW
ncbi:MAG: hypothetical protein ACTSRS_10430 [Candidatus Helarchaeota archaeon]